MQKIQPLADRVLVKPAAAEEKTVAGIIIPDSAKEKPLRGEIIAAGKGTKDEEMVLKTGDEVLFSSNGRQYTRTVEIPNNVATIGDYAFQSCSLLETIDLNNVTSISSYAFSSCVNLHEIDLKNVTTLGIYAFNGCSSFKIINTKNISALSLAAFRYCSSLETAIFPDGVNKSEVPQNAFSGCTSLRNCNLDIQVQTAVSYGITGTFPQCKEWTTDIPLTDEDGDGIFTVVISGLPAMSYQFKVRVNGEWTDSWGELDDGVTYNSQNNTTTWINI